MKRAAVERYGGRVIPCGPTQADREEAAARLVAETGATFVHPSNDPVVIAGQGTAGLELMESVPDLDVLLCPVGGGGLISGCAIAARGTRRGLRVLGAEPEIADDARRSLEAGRVLPALPPRSLCDGLLTSLGPVTFPLIQANVDSILAVPEDAIVAAMRLLWEVMKIVVEPSSAVPLAAVMAGGLRGRRIGIVLSGGNVDLDALPWVARG